MKTEDLGDALLDLVRMGIGARLKSLEQEIIKEAQEKVGRELARIIADVVIQLHKFASFERIGQELVIHVKLDTGKETQ